MKQVYLIRHCRPDFPPGKRICLGSTDIPLGPEGFAQAAEMAKILPEISALFASPLSRAVQTAQAIGKPIIIVDDLQEMDAGLWDGLDFDTIRVRFPELYAARGVNRNLPLPGGEPDAQALARFTEAMNNCAEQAPGDFAVVAHGGVIALFLESLGGTRYKPRYAEVIPLKWEYGTFTLQEEIL